MLMRINTDDHRPRFGRRSYAVSHGLASSDCGPELVRVGATSPPILSSTSVESPIIRKGRSDVKKRFTEAQIIGFLREAEAGLPVKDLCRRHGFSEASYYLWRSKFGGMTVSDAKRLKELETENGRLKKLLAESQLEIEVTREVLQKKW